MKIITPLILSLALVNAVQVKKKKKALEATTPPTMACQAPDIVQVKKNLGKRDNRELCESTLPVAMASGDINVCSNGYSSQFSWGDCCSNTEQLNEEIERAHEIPPQPCATKLTMSLSSTPGTEMACCSGCFCYGDPHCVSFNGKDDILLLCDTRVVENKDSKACMHSAKKGTAEDERECSGVDGAYHVENAGKCNWFGDQKKWNWDVDGSLCQPKEPEAFTLYSDDNFKIDITVGSIGIIEQVDITRAGGLFTMNAKDDCQSWTHNGASIASAPGVEWTKKQSLGDGLDTEWTLKGTNEEPTVTMTCFASAQVKKGQTVFTRKSHDQQRFNIRITQTQAKHTQSEGFCVEDVLPRWENSYDSNCVMVVDEPEVRQYCAATFDEYCEPIPNKFKGAEYRTWFSQDHIQDIFEVCVHEWCETRFLGDGVLGECLNHIRDFSWASAAETFPALSAIQEGNSCVSLESLESNSARQPSPCTEGFELQYQDAGAWVPFKWYPVPADTPVCADSSVVFNSDDASDSVLFGKSVRLVQYKCNDLVSRCESWGQVTGELRWSSKCSAMEEWLNENNMLDKFISETAGGY